jgi:hypothetical protein
MVYTDHRAQMLRHSIIDLDLGVANFRKCVHIFRPEIDSSVAADTKLEITSRRAAMERAVIHSECCSNSDWKIARRACAAPGRLTAKVVAEAALVTVSGAS